MYLVYLHPTSGSCNKTPSDGNIRSTVKPLSTVSEWTVGENNKKQENDSCRRVMDVLET
jgi:hypothetical protein